jgi:hypothetical protein
MNLSTTNGESGERENLVRRRVLAFDFDKKDLGQDFDHRDIIRIFKKNGLYYHAMVNTGGGYHVYVLIEDTNDIDRIIEVNAELAKRLGADPNAVKTTQILRVPLTYNHKYNPKKQVNLVHLAVSEKQRPYNLDKLHSQCCLSGEKFINYIQTASLHCINEILKGVPDGHRNFCLGRLTAYFKKNNYSKPQAFEIIKEWNTRCSPPEEVADLQKHFETYWDKGYKLLGCRTDSPEIQSILSNYCDRFNCDKNDQEEIIVIDEKVVELEHKHLQLIRNKKGFKMNGNHIAVMSILNIYGEGLSTKQIIEQLTSTITKKCCMSKNTVSKVLGDLADQKIIRCIEGKIQNQPNFYILNKVECDKKEILFLSYHSIQRFVDKVITPNELKVYCYMRYRKQTGKNLTQKEIAEDLNTTQKEISECINNLEKARYLIINRDYTINPNGVNFYIFLV